VILSDHPESLFSRDIAILSDLALLDRMAKTFELVFGGTKFAVPQPRLFYLFEHHTDLMAATSYTVQSAVPLEIFEIFVNSLKAGTKVAVTIQNADAISLLAKEFCFEELLSECSAITTVSPSELITALSELSTQNQ
jgi:hypothetical protein